MELILENVRCFHSRQVLPIKPLTLLIGENSTGKSTFMAALRIAWDTLWGTGLIDFNEDPFQLGTFDQIANYRGGRTARAKSFSIGFRLRGRYPGGGVGKPTETMEFHSEFVKGEAQPEVLSATIDWDNQRFKISRKGKRDSTEVQFHFATEAPKCPMSMAFPISQKGLVRYLVLVMDNISRRRGKMEIEGAEYRARELSESELIQLEFVSHTFHQTRIARPRAIAPIRSRPERVYATMVDSPVAGGEHFPMLLARAFRRAGYGSPRLREALKSFGKASGLFDRIDVKRLGPEEGDPFQILVGNHSPTFNLVDVGYGVSQVLPILVDALESEKGSIFLLQQPEVHLHPRAQAELGTFFGHLAKEHRKTFVVETHSDYIVDRVRMDIRDKKGLKPDDVAVLYFEKDKTDVKIHQIPIDKDGNIRGAPPGYRRFFMEEERRYFGG